MLPGPESFLGPTANTLESLRQEVDGVDLLIADLVAHRTALTLAVAAEKQARDMPVMVPERHAEVVANYTNAVSGNGFISKEDAVSLAELVMRISRNAQNRRLETQAAQGQQL